MKGGSILTESELIHALQALPVMRVTVQNLDNALSLLTPEERLVANLVLLYPKRNNIQLVCQHLHVEQSTAYRRRRQVLQKLLAALGAAGDRQADPLPPQGKCE